MHNKQLDLSKLSPLIVSDNFNPSSSTQWLTKDVVFFRMWAYRFLERFERATLRTSTQVRFQLAGPPTLAFYALHAETRQGPLNLPLEASQQLQPHLLPQRGYIGRPIFNGDNSEFRFLLPQRGDCSVEGERERREICLRLCGAGGKLTTFNSNCLWKSMKLPKIRKNDVNRLKEFIFDFQAQRPW